MKNNAHKSVCGRIAGHGDLASISHLTLDDIAIVELNEAINAEILKAQFPLHLGESSHSLRGGVDGFGHVLLDAHEEVCLFC